MTDTDALTRDFRKLYRAVREAAEGEGLGEQFDDLVAGLTFESGVTPTEPLTPQFFSVRVESPLNRQDTLSVLNARLGDVNFSGGQVTVTAVA